MVGTDVLFDSQGIVTRLFLPSDKDQHVLYAASKEDTSALVNCNRLRRLEAAYMFLKTSLEDWKNSGRSMVEYSKRLRYLKVRYDKEKNALLDNQLTGQQVSARKMVTLHSKRYQDNKDLRSRLFEQLKVAYAQKQVELKAKKPRVDKNKPSVVYYDPQSGLSLYSGNVYASGVNVKQREVLHSLMRETRIRRRNWKARSRGRRLSKKELLKKLQCVDDEAKKLEAVVAKETEGGTA